MVMRQNIAPEPYIQELLRFVDRFRGKALDKMAGLEDKTHYRRLAGNIFSDGLIGIVASYTLGHPIEAISERFNVFLQDAEHYFEVGGQIAPDKTLDQYIDCLRILSFCYFFSAPLPSVEMIIRNSPFIGEDTLMDRLAYASIGKGDVVLDKVAFPEIYQPLINALPLTVTREAQVQNVRVFLENYYPRLKGQDVGWYESHKEKDPKFFRHFGYWVFELGALVVDVDWDDAEYRNHNFYPKDLVDWRRNNRAV